MIFHPEHAENISYVYVVNEIFEAASDLLAKKYQKRLAPINGIVFVFISFCSVDKFLSMK